jgi:hypothetical protein
VRAAEGSREDAIRLYRRAIAGGLDAGEAGRLRERHPEFR